MRKRMGIARRDEHGAALARSGQPFRYWRIPEMPHSASDGRLRFDTVEKLGKCIAPQIRETHFVNSKYQSRPS